MHFSLFKLFLDQVKNTEVHTQVNVTHFMLWSILGKLVVGKLFFLNFSQGKCCCLLLTFLWIIWKFASLECIRNSSGPGQVCQVIFLTQVGPKWSQKCLNMCKTCIIYKKDIILKTFPISIFVILIFYTIHFETNNHLHTKMLPFKEKKDFITRENI